MTDGAVVEVEGLWKDYGPLHALADVTFEIGKGEVFGLLGRNGSGKTTLLRILTGYRLPTAGSVRVAGMDLIRRSLAVRRQIGYMPEHPQLYADLTVRGLLRFVGNVHGLSRARQKSRIEELTSHFGLGAVIDRLAGHCSKGYRARISLAAAVIHEPAVVFLDEPTDGLDPEQRHQTHELVRQLSEGEHRGPEQPRPRRGGRALFARTRARPGAYREAGCHRRARRGLRHCGCFSPDPRTGQGARDMRATLTVVRKELAGLFASPIAYIALTAMALSMSLFFLDNLKAFNTQIMLLQTRTAFNQIGAGMMPPGLNLFEQVLLPTVTETALVLLAVIPLITMGTFCEERTRRTDELLLTLPLSHTQIAAGKFLATFVFLVAVVAIAALLPAISAAHTELDMGPILASLAGLLLLSFALASIGLLCSALAANQLVAALSAYAISMAILDFSWMMEFTGDTADRVFQYLSLMTHMGGFPRGIISLADIVYFTGLGLGGFLLARVSLALERIN